jgi:hypothetical protein
MNAELESVFPNGVPVDFAINLDFEDEIEAIDAAAEICDVTL